MTPDDLGRILGERHRAEEGAIAAALGTLAILAAVAALLALGISFAARRGDDVRATRRALETIKPCRPCPAEESCPSP
jgi:hypothetical protein